MRVRVQYTVDVPSWWRREIRRWYGKDGYATRAEVREWLQRHGTSMDDDLALAADKRRAA